MIERYRWGVFRADLDPVVGSEQGGERPVLVISSEDFNQAMPIVTVLPLTSLRPGRRVYPNEVLLEEGAAGQPRDSVVLAHQIRTISKRRLGAPYGYVAEPELHRNIETAIRIHLDLNGY